MTVPNDSLEAALFLFELIAIVFIVAYTRWTLPDRSPELLTLRQRIAAPGGWWHNPAGITMVLEALALFLFFLLLTIASFVHFTYFVTLCLLWVEIGLITLDAIVLAWRTYAFWKIHRTRKIKSSR